MSSVDLGDSTITSDADSSSGATSAIIQGAAAVQQTTDTNVDAKTVAASSSVSSSATSAKASSTSDAKTTAQTTSTPSSSANNTPTSSATKGTTTSSSSASSTSVSSTASSSSRSTSITDAPSAQATQTSGTSNTDNLVATLVATSIDGHMTTVTSSVYASAAVQPTAQPQSQGDLSTTQSFFKNKGAVAGTFTASGIIFLILLLAVVLKIVRYRSNRSLERELDEQVEQEIRSGSPAFGFGKEDDGMSIMGGRGLADPEKAYGGAYANQAGAGAGYGNTAAYATYGAAAAQPAYYSPNSSNGAPRRYPTQTSSQFNGGLSRTNSGGSGRSYGTLNQPPMNAYAAPGPAFAPATFAGNYGEYRNASPTPSTQSGQSLYGPRPGTPSALTPGGRGSPSPAVPRGAYTPSPAVLARYGSQGSRDGGYGAYSPRADPGIGAFVPSGRPQIQTQTQGGLDVPRHGNNEPPSPNAALPNPFDQRD